MVYTKLIARNVEIIVSTTNGDWVARNVVKGPSVSIRYGNMTAGNVEVDVFVTMGTESLFVYLVLVLGFVCIRDRNTLVRSVKVVHCVSMGNKKYFVYSWWCWDL